jgi:DNA-binding MarR family transcriptional regulator
MRHTAENSRSLLLSEADGTSALIDEVIAGVSAGLLAQARLLARIVTGIFDGKLRPFGISAAQFTLLAAIRQTEPATRAEIARLQHLDKSTLTRNLRAILSEGWAEEVHDNADGRSRPLALTTAGNELLIKVEPAWLEAQAEANALLGQDGITAVLRTATRILNLPSVSIPNAEAENEDLDGGR